MKLVKKGWTSMGRQDVIRYSGRKTETGEGAKKALMLLDQPAKCQKTPEKNR